MPAVLSCTAWTERSGMRFSPVPVVLAARKPLWVMVTVWPSKVTVPFWPLALMVMCRV